jgi:preprotein translocase subunit SecG
MVLLAAGWFMHFLFGTLMLLISVFLILLVLVQRGRGGGLTGALGGAGGQSAFGTKAGDTFTRVTYGVAIVWIFICMMAIKVLQVPAPLAGGPSRPTVKSSPRSSESTETPETTTPAATTPSDSNATLTPEAPAAESAAASEAAPASEDKK